LFLVGAARSGTTLLQGLIASSLEVFSFPETHFFSKTIPMRKSKRLLWRFLPKDGSIIRRFLETVEYQNKEKLLQELPIKTISLKKWVKSLITILDVLALEKKYKIWLEKTPFHLRYIDVIERSTIENIHFIHIIRNGLDVVASLYEATNKFPEKWGKARSIDSCINRWIRDIKISKKYVKKENHHFVLYSNLVMNAKEELRKLSKIIGITLEEDLTKYEKELESLVGRDELWKKDTKGEISKRSKFKKVFTKEEQKYVESKVEKIDLTVFEK